MEEIFTADKNILNSLFSNQTSQWREKEGHSDRCSCSNQYQEERWLRYTKKTERGARANVESEGNGCPHEAPKLVISKAGEWLQQIPGTTSKISVQRSEVLGASYCNYTLKFRNSQQPDNPDSI